MTVPIVKTATEADEASVIDALRLAFSAGFCCMIQHPTQVKDT
jgi:hypothetical protein